MLTYVYGCQTLAAIHRRWYKVDSSLVTTQRDVCNGRNARIGTAYILAFQPLRSLPTSLAFNAFIANFLACVALDGNQALAINKNSEQWRLTSVVNGACLYSVRHVVVVVVVVVCCRYVVVACSLSSLSSLGRPSRQQVVVVAQAKSSLLLQIRAQHSHYTLHITLWIQFPIFTAYVECL